MRSIVLIGLVLATIFLVAPMSALAQEGDPSPIPDTFLEIPSPQDILLPVLLNLIALVSAVVSSPVTSTLTSIVKRITPKLPDTVLTRRIKNAEAREVNLAVAVVLIGFSWLTVILGVPGLFSGFIAFVMSLSTVVTGTAGAYIASDYWYTHIVKGAPGIGTSRAPLPRRSP